VDDNAVTIRRASDRRKFTMSIADLSDADQVYIKNYLNRDSGKNESVKIKSLVYLPNDATYADGRKPNIMSNPTRTGVWKKKEDVIQFKDSALSKGKYNVILSYGAGTSDKLGNYMGELFLEFNSKSATKKLGKKIIGTGGWQIPKDLSIGTFEHDGGSLVILLKIHEITGFGLMSVHSLTLTTQQ